MTRLRMRYVLGVPSPFFVLITGVLGLVIVLLIVGGF
jgi:hypothetical protein